METSRHQSSTESQKFVMAAAASSVLLVGCGLTGATTARLLVQAGLNVFVWEKARGAGGRMASTRLDGGGVCDMGAQYITKGVNELFSPNESVYEELVSAGVLQKFSGVIAGGPPPPAAAAAAGSQEDYIAPGGTSSIAKHMLQQSKCNVQFGRRLMELSVQDRRWCARSEDGAEETFDAVVITTPLPQTLRDMEGNFGAVVDEDTRSKMAAVQYSSRYALAAFYPDGIRAALDAIPWTVKYFDGDACLRYISLESRKRGRESVPALLLHTSVPYGLENVDRDKEEVEKEMLSRLPVLLGDSFSAVDPIHTKLIRWRYSQVRRPYAGAPGAVLLGADKELGHPPLILAGDAFTGSNFDGCIASAAKARQLVQQGLARF
jgi:renalase